MSLSLRIFCNVKSLSLSIKMSLQASFNMNLSLRIFANTGPGCPRISVIVLLLTVPILCAY